MSNAKLEEIAELIRKHGLVFGWASTENKAFVFRAKDALEIIASLETHEETLAKLKAWLMAY